MKHTITIECPHCGCTDLVKNGKENGVQRYRCKAEGCRKTFRLDYKYNAYKDGVKEQIDELTLNGSGVRDISRVLKISRKTISSHYKKNTKKS